jgi:hypothetical protein
MKTTEMPPLGDRFTATFTMAMSPIILALLAGVTWVLAAAEPDRTQITLAFSLDPRDSDACEKQLNRVYTALEQYRKVKLTLPNRLSDLIPQFLSDADALVCPYVKRTGNLTGWRLHVDQTVFDDPGSTYAYEFSNKASNWIRHWTMAEVKQYHMKFFGFGVPVVRCFAHRPRLNLAYNGIAYKSNFEWEDAYLTSREQRQAFHLNLANTNSFTSNMVVVARPARAGIDLTGGQLDLAPNFNAPLFHLARMDRRGQLLTTYPLSAECIGGVLFDVRGLLHLGGQGFPIDFPVELGGIRVEAACRRVHFLHGLVPSPHSRPASFTAGVTNAVYSIHFTDGRQEDFALVYGRDVKTLWFNPDEPISVGEAKPAWISALPSNRTALRLYMTTWTNAAPDRMIGSVSLRSCATNCAPFLVAVTVEDSAATAEK